MLCLHFGDILGLTDSIMFSLVHVDLSKLSLSLAAVEVLVDNWEAVFSWSLFSRWAVMLRTS